MKGSFSGDGGSIERRPDAITPDFLTSYSFGPVQLGDNTQGAVARVWRLRQEGTVLRLSRQDDTFTSFGPETVLFSYTGTPGVEIDFAFDQNGRIVCVVERAGMLWLYWFDAFAGGYVFTELGVGRTPRAVLDDYLDAQGSDVVIFYMDDSSGFLSYRQQRDRYAVVYPTAVPSANSYVEDVFKAVDSRIHVLYSVRDIPSGTYSLAHIESELYPVSSPDSDGALAGASFQSAQNLLVVIFASANDPDRTHLIDVDSYQVGAAFVSGLLVSPLLFIDPEGTYGWVIEIDAVNAGASFLSAAVPVVLILYTAYDIDAIQAGASLASATNPVIVIDHTTYDIDSYKAESSFVSATLT